MDFDFLSCPWCGSFVNASHSLIISLKLASSSSSSELYRLNRSSLFFLLASLAHNFLMTRILLRTSRTTGSSLITSSLIGSARSSFKVSVTSSLWMNLARPIASSNIALSLKRKLFHSLQKQFRRKLPNVSIFL